MAKFRLGEDMKADFNRTYPQREEEKLAFQRDKIMFEALMDIREMMILFHENKIKELSNLIG